MKITINTNEHRTLAQCNQFDACECVCVCVGLCLLLLESRTCRPCILIAKWSWPFRLFNYLTATILLADQSNHFPRVSCFVTGAPCNWWPCALSDFLLLFGHKRNQEKTVRRGIGIAETCNMHEYIENRAATRNYGVINAIEIKRLISCSHFLLFTGFYIRGFRTSHEHDSIVQKYTHNACSVLNHRHGNSVV